MDDRLKNALEEGARNGATEVFELHEKYEVLKEEAEKTYQTTLENLKNQFAENEEKYKFAQSILGGIINKLDKKE